MFAVAFVLLFAGFVTEASAVCYTSGDVKDIETGAAVSGVTVVMLDLSTNTIVDSTTTNSNGYYLLSVRGAGNFWIYVNDSTSGFIYREYTGTTPYFGSQTPSRSCSWSTSTQQIDFLRIRPTTAIGGQVSNNANPPVTLANRKVVFYRYDLAGAYAGFLEAYTDSFGNYTTNLDCGYKYTIFVESYGTEVVTAVNSLSGGGTFTQIGCIQAGGTAFDFTIAP